MLRQKSWRRESWPDRHSSVDCLNGSNIEKYAKDGFDRFKVHKSLKALSLDMLACSDTQGRMARSVGASESTSARYRCIASNTSPASFADNNLTVVDPQHFDC